jgi:hypothetical protein
MFLYPVFQAVVDLLPEGPPVWKRNLYLVIDHHSCHGLAHMPCKDLCLGLIQFKAHGPQKAVDLAIYRRNTEVPRKCHIITVSGIHNPPIPAPALHICVKRLHHQVGYGCGRRGPLRKTVLAAAQGGKERPHRNRKIPAVKGAPMYHGEGNASKKVLDIQLQYHLLIHMAGCI